MANLDDIPNKVHIPDDMREQFAELDIVTPFPEWIKGLAWEQINTLRKKKQEATA